jgi:catechol 2,3-dioxygenase-like lactoylglutathione lyase family enzyme
MPPKPVYVIAFVSDMDRAVKFYRDTLRLRLKFSSPHWSEFVTGDTTVALHPARSRARRAPSAWGSTSRR